MATTASLWSVVFLAGILLAAMTARGWKTPTGTRARAFSVAALGALLGAPFMLALTADVVDGGTVRAPTGIIVSWTMLLSLPLGVLGLVRSLRMAPWRSLGGSFDAVRLAMTSCWVLSSIAIVLTVIYT